MLEIGFLYSFKSLIFSLKFQFSFFFILLKVWCFFNCFIFCFILFLWSIRYISKACFRCVSNLISKRPNFLMIYRTFRTFISILRVLTELFERRRHRHYLFIQRKLFLANRDKFLHNLNCFPLFFNALCGVEVNFAPFASHYILYTYSTLLFFPSFLANIRHWLCHLFIDLHLFCTFLLKPRCLQGFWDVFYFETT